MKYKVKIYLCTVIITAIVATILYLYAIVEHDVVQTTVAQRGAVCFYLGSLLFMIFGPGNLPLPLVFICSFLYFAFFFCPVMGMLKVKEKKSFYGIIAFYGLIVLQIFILLAHLYVPIFLTILILAGFD